MVLNLWQSRQLLDDLAKDNDHMSEYVKNLRKHMADNSFYQLPTLGIQITCEDVGILGPLALLAFSLFSVTAFKSLLCHVKCGTKGFEENSLIRALLEIEYPLDTKHALDKYLIFGLRTFLFLPLAACLFVIAYGVMWHFFYPPNITSFPEIAKNIPVAKMMDVIGCIFALLVLVCNWHAVSLSNRIETAAREAINAPQELRK